MVKNIFNTGKIFRANSFFKAIASCSKILNSKKIFNTVYSVHIHLGMIRVIWASVVCNLAKVVTGYNDFDLDQSLVFWKN